MSFWHALGIGLSIHTMIWAHEVASTLLELIALTAIVGWLWTAGKRDDA